MLIHFGGKVLATPIANMEFNVPLSRNELLPSKEVGGSDGYTVRDLLTSQELTSRIDGVLKLVQ